MKIKKRDRVGLIACYIMAFTSLAAAIYHFQVILPLQKEGIRTAAIVVDIYRGSRNSKWAIYQFNIESGQQVTARDKFQMYIIRQKKGDQVTVIYDPANPQSVTADIGIWIWQGPAILLFGFVFLTSLGILILKFRSK